MHERGAAARSRCADLGSRRPAAGGRSPAPRDRRRRAGEQEEEGREGHPAQAPLDSSGPAQIAWMARAFATAIGGIEWQSSSAWCGWARRSSRPTDSWRPTAEARGTDGSSRSSAPTSRVVLARRARDRPEGRQRQGRQVAPARAPSPPSAWRSSSRPPARGTSSGDATTPAAALRSRRGHPAAAQGRAPLPRPAIEARPPRPAPPTAPSRRPRVATGDDATRAPTT